MISQLQKKLIISIYLNYNCLFDKIPNLLLANTYELIDNR